MTWEITYAVECAACHFGIGNRLGWAIKGNAIKAWNTRAAERLAKIEALEECRDKSEYKMNPEMYRFFTERIAELKETGE